ncbi:GSCOCG00000506001-RA-CDS [Cotesia congregata]|nr:GSCOCG00000506001-RA-CDS [Cotesia congregata]
MYLAALNNNKWTITYYLLVNSTCVFNFIKRFSSFLQFFVHCQLMSF